MPKFYVRETFEIPDRNLFVLAGSILEGEIKAGMFVRVPLNSSYGIRILIDSIEFARRTGGSEDVCLCTQTGKNFLEILRGLNFGNETFEVTEEGKD